MYQFVNNIIRVYDIEVWYFEGCKSQEICYNFV